MGRGEGLRVGFRVGVDGATDGGRLGSIEGAVGLALGVTEGNKLETKNELNKNNEYEDKITGEVIDR